MQQRRCRGDIGSSRGARVYRRSSMPFASLGLAPELVRAVADEGYAHPTPIQSEAIPLALAGRDHFGLDGGGVRVAFIGDRANEFGRSPMKATRTPPPSSPKRFRWRWRNRFGL